MVYPKYTPPDLKPTGASMHTLFIAENSTVNIYCKNGKSALQIYGIQKIYNGGGNLKFIGCDPYTQYAILRQATDDAQDAMKKVDYTSLYGRYSYLKHVPYKDDAKLMRIFKTSKEMAQKYAEKHHGFKGRNEQEKLF